MKKPIAATLVDRGSIYGNYRELSALIQRLKSVMHASRNWAGLPADQKESLEMTMMKIGRILNGDPDCFDSWHDAEGYLKLIADRLAA
jgi:hypothetical protein